MANTAPPGYKWITTKYGAHVMVPDEDFAYRQDIETGNFVSHRDSSISEFVDDIELGHHMRELEIEKAQEEAKRLNRETASRDKELKSRKRAEEKQKKVNTLKKEIEELKEKRDQPFQSPYLIEAYEKDIRKLERKLKTIGGGN